jgi:glycosyltransferase involved in cell wall biosynthesis
MSPPLVSCIVPVCNAERYVGEAIESIFAQTYRPLEVIVVDDGSTDTTAKELDRYAGRIVRLWQPNAGPAGARNRGIEAATGDFFALLDADDVWRSEKLTLQMSRFEARPDLDLSVTLMRNFWIPELRAEEERLRGDRLTQTMPGYQTLLVRRSAFERVGLFDASRSFGSDIDWFVRAREKGVVIEVLPEILVDRRLHRGNRSRLVARGNREERLDIVKAYLDRRRAQRGGG